MKHWGWVAFAFAVTVVKAGWAEEAGVDADELTDSPATTGVEVAVRLAYALPWGYAFEEGTRNPLEDNALSEAVSAHIPLQVDLGYRFDEHWMLGGYFSWGPGLPTSGLCDEEGVDCSAGVMRVGAQVQYAILPVDHSYSPWVGAGIGYEAFTLDFETSIADIGGDLAGLEFLNLQGGCDFSIADRVRLGPFVLVSFGQYSSYHLRFGDAEDEVEDFDQALHGWFAFGARGAFGAF